MTTLSLEARTLLDRYLSQIRLSLGGTASVDAEEVKRDVREHIDRWNNGKRRSVAYWVRLIAAIASLIVLFGGMVAFGVHTLDRQKRTEEMIENFIKQQASAGAKSR